MPNARRAGNEPQISEMMIPRRIARTVAAAARVRCRKATSPNRRRCRTFARSSWAAFEIPVPCNATSATDRLPVDCIGLSLAISPLWRATQAASWPQHKPPVCRHRTQRKGACSGALSIAFRSIGHREEGLATRVLDLARPGLLDILHDVGRHRNVIEFFSHLVAVLVGPCEELKRLAGSGHIAWLLVEEDPRSRGHRP